MRNRVPGCGAKVGGAGDPIGSAWGQVLVFSLEKSPFYEIFVSRFHRVFTPKTGFSFKKRPLVPPGRERSVSPGRERFWAGRHRFGPPKQHGARDQ